MLALFLLGGIREILGSRTLLGFTVLPEFYEPWLVMILPAGAFLTLGLMMGFFNTYSVRKKRIEKEAIIQAHLNKKSQVSPASGEDK